MIEIFLILLCLFYVALFVYALFEIIKSTFFSVKEKFILILILFLFQPIGLIICFVYYRVSISRHTKVHFNNTLTSNKLS
jgi:hypothetical protein